MRIARATLVPAALLLLVPLGVAGQYVGPETPPELFELEQMYILPRGVFHGFVQGSALPLSGDDVQGPFSVGAKLGVHRAFQVEVDLRDRLGTEAADRGFDPLDPFTELEPDTADDVRVRGSLRMALPAPPLDVISASAGFITSIRGEETVLMELSLGAAHRLGGDGPTVGGQVIHRRGLGSDEGPEGGDIQSTVLGGMAMAPGAGLLWSVEGSYQINSGAQGNAGRITPGAYWRGPVDVALGVPVVLTADRTEWGLSATLGVTVGLGGR